MALSKDRMGLVRVKEKTTTQQKGSGLKGDISVTGT